MFVVTGVITVVAGRTAAATVVIGVPVVPLRAVMTRRLLVPVLVHRTRYRLLSA